jgi:CubicO group peptidase (beta-lactamase class C family)
VKTEGIDQELADEIDAYVRRQMSDLHSPGIAVGIVKGDRVVYQGYFGWAHVKDKEPVTENTVFRIGSISKTFTAIGLMQQWEQGKFKLDDEFNSYLPYPVMRPKDESCGPITFKHMITHTSGGGELMSFRQLRHPTRTLAMPPGKERPALKEAYVDGIRPGVCAGVKWCYCNFCYGALGFSLEELSGETFKDYTQNHVLEPIGMKSSSFHEHDHILENIAQGYSYNKIQKKYKETFFWNMPVTPMGNMYSTVPDMCLYLIALLNNGANEHGRLVEPETLEFMYRAHYSAEPRVSGMGITFLIHEDLFGERVLGHGGAVPGFGSQMLFAPDKKVGVIVFGNVMSSPPYEIGAGVLRMMLGYEAPKEWPEPDREVWPALAGYYGSAHPEFLSDARFNMATLGAYRVLVRDGELVVTTFRGGKFRPLTQFSADDPYFYTIIIEDRELPGYVTFVPGPGGSAQSIIIGMNEYVRLTGADLARARAKAVALSLLPSSF